MSEEKETFAEWYKRTRGEPDNCAMTISITDPDAVLGFADQLDDAERIGNWKDDPEGTQWITISDTLAKEMASRLREFHSSVLA